MRLYGQALVLSGLAALGSGCAGAAASSRPAVIELEEVVISSDSQLREDFERARVMLHDGQYASARALFDEVSQRAESDEIKVPALFNRAVAREGEGDRDVAVAEYEALLVAYPAHPLALSAAVRVEQCLAYLERWSELVVAASRVLARSDVSLIDQIGAHGYRALGHIEQGELESAARDVDRGRSLIEDNQLGQSGVPALQLGVVSFASGEVARVRSERIVFTPMPSDFADALERRCAGLLDAQNAYTQAIRSEDFHWSAMAGLRIGQLYQRLYDDVMAVPYPTTARTEAQRQLFEGALRLRYRILLEKGLALIDATVRLGERTHQTSRWIERAREAKTALTQAMADAKRGIEGLPYTEAELEAALSALGASRGAKP